MSSCFGICDETRICLCEAVNASKFTQMVTGDICDFMAEKANSKTLGIYVSFSNDCRSDYTAKCIVDRAMCC